jgi:hypothetical protein
LFKAQLVGVYTVGEMPDELRPFVNLEARRRRRELSLDDRFIALQIEGTLSYLTFFLDTISSISQLESELKEQECELTPVSRISIEKVIEHHRANKRS